MHDDAHAQPEVGHVVPLWLLAAILAALLFLTFVTVAVTYVDLGQFNILVALAIAVLKASLVALYFMHLRWDRPFNAIVLIISLVMASLFIGLALLDTAAYLPEMIPGHAPDMPPR